MEIKGYILWNKDLKRVGYVYKTRASAEIGKFKSTFIDCTGRFDMSKPMTVDVLETIVEHAMEEIQKSPTEIREVTVTIKETHEEAE